MTSPRRITQQQIDQAISIALSEYRDGINTIQEFIGGKLSLPLLPNPVFKVRIFSNTLSELVHSIQEVSDNFGKLDLLQDASGYESTLNKLSGGWNDGTLYFSKSQSMIESDMKLVSEAAESNLRDEINAHNANLIASDENELKAIELEEVKEQQKLRQVQLDKIARTERKKALQEKLAT